MRNVLIAMILLGLGKSVLAESTGSVYRQATAAFESQDWTEAAAKFKQAYQCDPTSPEAEDSLFFWGESLLSAGRFRDAQKRFDDYLRQWPEGRRTRAARFRTAETLMLDGHHQEAKYRIQRFVILYPSDPLLEYTTTYLAEIAVVENDLEEAERLFNQVIETYPDGSLAARCRLGLARIEASQGNLDASLAQLEPILQHRDPENQSYREAVVLQSSLPTKLGRSNIVSAAVSEACKVTGKEACKVTGESTTSKATDAPKETSQAAKTETAKPATASDPPRLQAVNNDSEKPSSPDVAAMWRQACFFQHTKKLGPALVAYEDLYQKYPHTPEADEARVAAARLYVQLRQPGKAKAIYDELLVRAGCENSKLSKPTLLFEAARTQEILEKEGGKKLSFDRSSTGLLERLLRECPQSPEATRAAYRLACRAADDGDFTAARTRLEKSLDSKDTMIVARSLQLSWRIAVEEENWNAVREAATRLLSLDESKVPVELDHQARFWIAEVDYRTGQLNSARHRFAALAKRIEGKDLPWAGLVALRSAQSLARSGNFTEARQAAEKATATLTGFADRAEFDCLIGQCAFVQGEYGVARLAFDRVIKSPTAASTETRLLAQEAIAATLFAQENYESAIAEFTKLQADDVPDSYLAKSLHYTALCHERLGRKSDAEALYQRLVDRYPDYPLR